jgi:hypothetical protein
MSLARIHQIDHARKEWECGKCGVKIEIGDPYLHFSVGFRGFKRVRCMKVSCFPDRATRESSLIGDVYSAMDDVDWGSLNSMDQFEEAMQGIADACDEVAQQYMDNPTYNGNDDLQEKVAVLEDISSQCSSWAPEQEEPDAGNYEGDVAEVFEDAVEEWLDNTREEAQEFVNGLETP